MLKDVLQTPAMPRSRSKGRRHGNAALSLTTAALAATAFLSATAGAASPVGAATGGETISGASDAAPEIRRYCTNVAVAAGDARFAWQTAKLAEVEARIKAHVQDLEARTSELRAWIAKREAVEKQAKERLVDIYAKMRPETAATQIAGLDDDMAAAVLSQLTPGKASAIFNELVPERATKLAALIAAAPAATTPDPSPAGDKKP